MKVFLSSTYVDLVEYRDAVHAALDRLGQEVGRMEIFGARTEEATSAALTQLEKCELVIGIYAYRYGTIPEGSDVSITEQEYLHAETRGKPVLCFVVDENQPWPPKMMEKDPVKIKKLDDFKTKILKEKVVDFFTAPADLGMKVATSVHNYLEEHKAIIDSQHPIYEHPKPTGSTLPKQEFFFGRAEELKTIAAALSPETRAWGALIDGPGGIGKTALAIKSAHHASNDLFERKIFITAKVRELTPEGEKKLTDFTRPTYLAMLDELGKELGEDGLGKLPPHDRPNALRLALAEKKALIIFDNLETLPEEERTRLFQFLSRLPDGNKAIVTSRRRSDVDARVVRLDRLSHTEAMQLIVELALKYPRLSRATQKERDDLYAITQGNPLFIRWIAGQLGREGSKVRTIAEASTFLAQAPKGNDPLEYIFGDLLETFTENETLVLAALTYFTQPAKPAWISQMTELPEGAAQTALEDLADRSVLTSNAESRTFYLPPLAAQFIRTRRPEAVAKTGNILTNYAYALVVQNGGATNYEGFRTLDAEWDLIAAAMPRLLTGDNARLQTICRRLFQFLNFTGRWDDLIWLSEQAEARALAVEDKENAGSRANNAGWAYSFRNQPTEVLACAARAAEHWQDSTPYNKALAIRLRGIGHKRDKNYPAAIDALREALEIWRSISPESIDVAIALNDLAGIEYLKEDYPAAERDYREALRISKNNDNEEGIATTNSSLANLALKREEWAEAEFLAREALVLAEKVGRQMLIAGVCRQIAEAMLKQNRNLEKALSFSHRAVEIYRRLRVSGELRLAQETFAEIEKKIIENQIQL